MDLNLIKKLVKIVDTSEITDLEVEENGLRIKVAKKIRGTQSRFIFTIKDLFLKKKKEIMINKGTAYQV